MNQQMTSRALTNVAYMGHVQWVVQLHSGAKVQDPFFFRFGCCARALQPIELQGSPV